MIQRLGVAVVMGPLALALTPPWSAAGAPGDPPADLPAAGARAAYEASLGQPPRVLTLSGHVGHAWIGTPGYIAGASTYSRGEFIYNDPVFDDTGADTSPGDTEAALAAIAAATLPGLCAAGSTYRYGDYTYPADPSYGGNAADLAEIRLASDSSSYYVAFVLQTMIDPTRAVVGLGINGPGPAPLGLGFHAFQHYLQIAPGGASLDGVPVTSGIDRSQHLLEARIPRGSLPAGPWQVAAAAGVWSGGGWAAVTDLAFVHEQLLGADPSAGGYNCWLDHQQSALIAAGTYPTAAVDPARLDSGYSDPPSIPRGAMVRLDYPSIHMGDGEVAQNRYGRNASDGALIYQGHFQPYAIYVPSSYDPARPNPLVMLMHCLNCNYMTYFISSAPHLFDLAEARGAIIVTPLAYGEGGHYEAEAEYDVFDVLSDVSARFNIDRERLYLTGMSMGSLGTFRLGLLYPDLWARAFGVGNYTIPNCVTLSPTVSYPSCGTLDYYELIDNARNLPWGLVNGGLDELTPLPQVTQIAMRYNALGYPYRFWVLPNRTHDPSLEGQTTDLTGPWIADGRRVSNPARVTYVIDRAMFNPQWHLLYDRAYWLRDMRLASGAGKGSVDATSGSGWTYTTTPAQGSGTSIAGPYTMSGLDLVPGQAAGGNTLSLTLRSLTSLTVSLAAASLSTAAPLTLTVDTDTPAVIRLQGCVSLVSAPTGKSSVTIDPATCSSVATVTALTTTGSGAATSPAPASTGASSGPLPFSAAAGHRLPLSLAGLVGIGLAILLLALARRRPHAPRGPRL